MPWTSFARIVDRPRGNAGIRTLTCAEQFHAMPFAQLTWRESLRDIEVSLGANASKLYAMGFRSLLKHSTLADANESREWRIRFDLATLLIRLARKFYASDSLAIELNNTVYAMDRGYVDFSRLYALHKAGAFFIMRAESPMDARGAYLTAVDLDSGLICDQRVTLNDNQPRRYREHLRFVRFKDPASGKTLVFLANNTVLPALTICAFYQSRWRAKLFFKWVKQRLRIKKFLGTSENAAETQVWCAVAIYVLIAIVKKELQP